MKTLEQKLSRIAAIIALDNFDHPIGQTMNQDFYPWTGDARSEVCQIGADYICSPEVEKVFCEEAEIWYASLLNVEFRQQQLSQPRNSWAVAILEMT